jgi:microcystin-dependent protein
MATVTPAKVFTSNEIVTPANLNLLGTPTVALADGEVTTVKIADAAVTTPKLATSTQQALLPAGAIMPFARTTAPAGWLIANGNVVPNGNGTIQGVTADYTALYEAVRTNFGAAGTLPDLRGIFVRGSESQIINGVTYSGAFGTKQVDAYPSHNHGFSDYYQSTAGLITAAPKIQDGGDTTYTVATGGGGDTGNWTAGTHLNGTQTGTDYRGSGTETRPANIALLYCIKI